MTRLYSKCIAPLVFLCAATAVAAPGHAQERERALFMLSRAREKREVVVRHAMAQPVQDAIAKGDVHFVLAQARLKEGRFPESCGESDNALEEYLRAGRIARELILEAGYHEESSDYIEKAAAQRVRAKKKGSAPGLPQALYNGDENLKAARHFHDVKFFSRAIFHAKNAMKWYSMITGN